LGDRRVLVEVNRDTPAGFLELLLDRLGELELRLVLAHPERCPALHSQPHLIDHARSRGTLVQVVAPSLVGRWGETAAQAAWRLLESGRVDILASDAHRPSHSRFSLRQALPVLAQRLGATRLRMLTEDCPAAALSV
jgi:protein-tyrosine phosphatase